MSSKPQQDIKSDTKKTASDILKSMYRETKNWIKLVEKKMIVEENLQQAKTYLINAERIISEIFNYIYTILKIFQNKEIEKFFILFIKTNIIKAIILKKELWFKAGATQLDWLVDLAKSLEASTRPDTIHYLLMINLTYQNLYL